MYTQDNLAQAIAADCAVAMLTHVNYRTGYQHDMAAISSHCHAQGALALWDLAHSAGAVPGPAKCATNSAAQSLARCSASWLSVGCSKNSGGTICVPHSRFSRLA